MGASMSGVHAGPFLAISIGTGCKRPLALLEISRCLPSGVVTDATLSFLRSDSVAQGTGLRMGLHRGHVTGRVSQ